MTVTRAKETTGGMPAWDHPPSQHLSVSVLFPSPCGSHLSAKPENPHILGHTPRAQNSEARHHQNIFCFKLLLLLFISEAFKF